MIPVETMRLYITRKERILV